MKLVYTLGKLDVGGAEIRSLRLFQGLKERGVQIDGAIYIISGHTGALDEKFEKLGLKLVYGRPGLRGLFHLWRFLIRFRPKVFHTNVSTANGYYALVAKMAGTPVVISHYRSLDDVRAGTFHKVKAALGRLLTNGLSQSVVGVCDSAQSFARAPDRKWVTLYNGIDLPDAEGGDSRVVGLTIGYLGRISTEKNPHRALEVLQSVLLDSRGKTARLRIAGGGSPEQMKALAKDVKQRGLENHVELCGVTDRPIDFLQRCTVLLLPSHREGLPGAVLEALSVGVPVVASDLAGVREIATAVEGVLTRHLSATNTEWAESVFEAAAMDRRAIAASFAQGPFLINGHVQAVISLWKPGPSTSGVAP